MAHMISVTPILIGPALSIFHVFMESDGVSGELTDHVLVDPAVDIAGQSSKTRLNMQTLCYSLASFDAKLEYDSGLIDDKMIWVLSHENRGGENFFNVMGGFKDRSGDDGTGKLQISTTGFASAGAMGSIIFSVKY